VSRGAVLLAKYLSVALFVALSLSLQYLVATGAGLVFFGTDGPWREVFLGYLATGVADLSFAAVAFAITALFRSVAGTVLITMLFIVFEKIAAWALFVVSSFVQALPPEMNNLPQAVYLLFDLQPGLPSAAWNVGTTLASGGEVALITWAAAAFYLAAGGLVALLRTLWMEVP
jgi:ABC-type transport system involved in multi-copper enzyme maturation permease subunit